MEVELVLLKERPSASVAEKVSDPGVHASHVSVEVPLLEELGVALAAPELASAVVVGSVVAQLRVGAESLVALVASVRLGLAVVAAAAVDALHMLAQVDGLVELAATVRAGEGQLAGVSEAVAAQEFTLQEAGAAVGARKATRLVLAQVALVLAPLAEALSAVRTGKVSVP